MKNLNLLNDENKLCPKCLNVLKNEDDKVLKQEYPYVCTSCDENFYEIEVVKATRVF